MKIISYLRAGGDVVLRSDELIGIFDIDNSTTSKKTVEFLNGQEKKGRMHILTADIPASFLVTDKGVYLSQLSSRTLKNRFY